jgi:hypothetical protein
VYLLLSIDVSICREKNKIVMLQNGVSSAMSHGQSSFMENTLTDGKKLRHIEHLLYWGLVINFNPATGKVETFIPPRIHDTMVSFGRKAQRETLESVMDSAPPPKIYADTELLGCRVKMDGIRGMVDSITMGDSGTLLFQVQFSDGRRLSMCRSELEPILSDIDIAVVPKERLESCEMDPPPVLPPPVYVDEQNRKFVVIEHASVKPNHTFVVSPFHSSVVYFADNRLKKTTDSSEFVTYTALLLAFKDFTSTSVAGTSMWFRNYMQKRFRVTYVKVDGPTREMVLYGGVQKGLKLV